MWFFKKLNKADRMDFAYIKNQNRNLINNNEFVTVNFFIRQISSFRNHNDLINFIFMLNIIKEIYSFDSKKILRNIILNQKISLKYNCSLP